MEAESAIELLITMAVVAFLGFTTIRNLLAQYSRHPAPFLSEDEEYELDKLDEKVLP